MMTWLHRLSWRLTWHYFPSGVHVFRSINRMSKMSSSDRQCLQSIHEIASVKLLSKLSVTCLQSAWSCISKMSSYYLGSCIQRSKLKLYLSSTLVYTFYWCCLHRLALLIFTVNLLQLQLTGDIHEEVENHNRMLDRMVLVSFWNCSSSTLSCCQQNCDTLTLGSG